MCGFVAWIGRNQEADKHSLTRMLNVIRHRGPDDEGLFFSKNVGLGFRRLAILDLTPAGHQPMSSANNRYTIVFNGEIYNYIEIRAELIGKGYNFRSNTDTEVLLNAYIEWGEECLTRLNGMWAFLVFDKENNTIFGARDRFGMKPLYYYDSGSVLLFASEIKAIRVSGNYRESLNHRVCASYFHEKRLDDTNDTFFAGIFSIPAAYSFRIGSDGKLSLKRYWAPPLQLLNPENPAEKFSELFDNAVNRHLRSDVPVGVNLSGGLDSTSIICNIAKQKTENSSSLALKAFCYADRDFDESEYVSATLAQTSADVNKLELSPKELWNSLPDVLWYQDEPVHTITAVVSFHLSGLAAKNGVKVVMNGQGADETLGGYPSYFKDRWTSLLITKGYRALKSEINDFTSIHGGDCSSIERGVVTHVVKSSIRRFSLYRQIVRNKTLRQYENDDWFDPELSKHLTKTSEYEAIDLRSTLERAISKFPLPLYLRLEDRNSMAHSIEARLPFLDSQLVEFAHSLSDEWKLSGPWNKYVLREAMQKKIPENVRTRPDKMGFPTPFGRWLKDHLYEAALEIIHDPSFDRSLFRVESIKRDLVRHKNGEGDYSRKLFDVLQFNIWKTINPEHIPNNKLKNATTI